MAKSDNGGYPDDNNPLEENLDDYEVALGVLPDKSIDDVDKENAFVPMPDGEKLLNFHKISIMKKIEHFECWLGKRKTGYNSTTIQVTYCLPENPRCQVSDFHRLPPLDEDELIAYNEGANEEGKNKGFMASKLKNLVGHMGWEMPADNSLPAEAAKLKNWLFLSDGKTPRQIIATTETPKNPGVDKNGNPRKAYPNIRLFSYKDAPVQQTKPVRPSGGNGGKTASKSAGSAAGKQQQQSQASTAKEKIASGEFDV